MRVGPYERSKGFKGYLGSEIKLDDDGEFHSDKGPAIIDPNGDKFWFIHGKMHRVDGPAAEFNDGFKEWFIDDKQVLCATQEEFEKLLKMRAFW